MGDYFGLMSLAFWMVLERLTGLHDQHMDQHAIYNQFCGYSCHRHLRFGGGFGKKGKSTMVEA